MKPTIFTIGTMLIMAFKLNDLEWVIEPKYDEIIVYGERSFVAKEGAVFKVLDYNEKTLYEFTDNEIVGLGYHPNEGGELQEVIHVKYQNDKSRLFNIKTLRFLHEERYSLLQTQDSYEPERRLIRVMDELKEGVMDFDGNMILPPIYKEVLIEEEFKIGFGEDAILVFKSKNELLQKLPFQGEGADFIEQKKFFKVQKEVRGEANIFKEQRGPGRIDYIKERDKRMVSGIVDINNKEIIPFLYSSIFVKSDNCLAVTKNEKITKEGFAIPYFKPKIGLIDFSNQEILPIEYKSISVIEGGLVQVENFEGKIAVFNVEKRIFETDFLFDTYAQAAQKISELDLSSKLIKFKENELLGMMNRKGEILIPAKYSGIYPTEHSEIFYIYAACEDGYQCEGFYHIGLKKEIVPPLFTADRGKIGGHKRNNQKNVISVMSSSTSKIGFYKTDGTKISDPIFEEYEGFSEDLAPVFVDFSSKTGMININGELVFDYIFDSMTLPYDGKSIVSYEGQFGILKLR